MPREIMRLVSVTTPAPVTTPRIPSSGLLETSAGIAAAAARAMSIGEGGTVRLEGAILVRLSPRPVNYLPGILVDPKFGRVTDLHVGQLGFTIVRQHPLRDINERDDLRARRNKLPRPDLAFAHSALAG